MKREIYILLVALTAFLPIAADACPGCIRGGQPIEIPAGLGKPHMYSSGTTNLVMFHVGYAEIHTTPKWDQKTAPPLTRERAIATARVALGIYASSPEKWEVEQTQLNTFHETDWWFYLVRFKLTISHSDSHKSFEHFSIPVLMDGNVIKAIRMGPTNSSNATSDTAPSAASEAVQE